MTESMSYILYLLALIKRKADWLDMMYMGYMGYFYLIQGECELSKYNENNYTIQKYNNRA